MFLTLITLFLVSFYDHGQFANTLKEKTKDVFMGKVKADTGFLDTRSSLGASLRHKNEFLTLYKKSFIRIFAEIELFFYFAFVKFVSTILPFTIPFIIAGFVLYILKRTIRKI